MCLGLSLCLFIPLAHKIYIWSYRCMYKILKPPANRNLAEKLMIRGMKLSGCAGSLLYFKFIYKFNQICFYLYCTVIAIRNMLNKFFLTDWVLLVWCINTLIFYVVCIVKKQIILQYTIVQFSRQLPITLSMQFSGPLIKMWLKKLAISSLREDVH